MSAGVYARARSGLVTQRCHNRNPRWETELGSANDVMHRKCAEDFGGFEKNQLSWELDTGREGSTFGARRGQTNLRATGAARDGGGDRWKSQNRKNVYLSSYVEEHLNSKVIKSFVPELRSRKCFSCFGIPMFYVYMLWTFYVRFTYPYHGYGTIVYVFQWCLCLDYWVG